MKNFLSGLLFLSSFLLPTAHILSAPPDASALVEKAEKKIRAAKTLRFDVIQRYVIEGLSAHVEEGSVSFARPVRVRWEYARPERKLFVADGKRAFYHVPSENTVYALALKDAAKRSPVLSFLLEARPLKAAYTFALVETDKESGELVVRATPFRAEEKLSSFLMYVSPDGEFRRISYLDAAGGLMEIYFMDFRYNPPLDDALFRFSPPAGTEIVEGFPFEQ